MQNVYAKCLCKIYAKCLLGRSNPIVLNHRLKFCSYVIINICGNQTLFQDFVKYPNFQKSFNKTVGRIVVTVNIFVVLVLSIFLIPLFIKIIRSFLTSESKIMKKNNTELLFTVDYVTWYVSVTNTLMIFYSNINSIFIKNAGFLVKIYTELNEPWFRWCPRLTLILKLIYNESDKEVFAVLIVTLNITFDHFIVHQILIQLNKFNSLTLGYFTVIIKCDDCGEWIIIQMVYSNRVYTDRTKWLKVVVWCGEGVWRSM